ncbi:MAG TPA: ABC transporter substrate-binding protein [bacterium]|nr:ABC transporter substrate-binding protein [bacterium]
MSKILKYFLVTLLSISLVTGIISVSFSQQKVAPGQYATIAEYQKVSGKKITKFSEAPQLADLVKQGKLPSVEKRLSEEPAVVEPIEEIGQYGGSLQGPHLGRAPQYTRITYEPLVRWNLDTDKVIPNVAKSWKISNGGKVITFYLRKGMKWSDGEPFTADDIIFWYEDITLNKDLTPVFPSWLIAGGKPGKVEKVDNYTVRFVFDVPYTFLLQRIASGQDCYAPKHYLKKFHPKYTSMDEIMKQAKEEGFDAWYKLFGTKATRWQNKDLPVVTAWKVVTPLSDAVFTAERNPYYWKVDPAGNQLPYIDKIVWTLSPDREVRVMKHISGEASIGYYDTFESDYTIVMENQKKGGYRVLKWLPALTNVGTLFINQNVKDPVLKKLFTNVQFRRALSLAINRNEIAQLIYSGNATPRQAVPFKGSPYYEERFEKSYIEYNPKKASQMLDQVGLAKRDKDGYRIGPDGKTLEILIEVLPGIGPEPDIAEMIKGYFRDVGLKVSVKTEETSLWVTRAKAGEQQIGLYASAGAYYPLLDPVWFFPVSDFCYWAPLCGLWYSSNGKSGEEPSGEIKQLLNVYDQAVLAVGEKERTLLIKRALDIYSKNLWTIGIVAPNTRLVIVKNELRNVPEVTIHENINNCPGHTNPEQWFFKK